MRSSEEIRLEIKELQYKRLPLKVGLEEAERFNDKYGSHPELNSLRKRYTSLGYAIHSLDVELGIALKKERAEQHKITQEEYLARRKEFLDMFHKVVKDSISEEEYLALVAEVQKRTSVGNNATVQTRKED